MLFCAGTDGVGQRFFLFLRALALAFFDIFFSVREGDEAEHVTFCRQLPFLRRWPVHKIHENPGSCMFHFFR